MRLHVPRQTGAPHTASSVRCLCVEAVRGVEGARRRRGGIARSEQQTPHARRLEGRGLPPREDRCRIGERCVAVAEVRAARPVVARGGALLKRRPLRALEDEAAVAMRRGHLCVSPHDGHPRVGGVEAREGRAGDEVARGGREEQAPARRLHRQGVHHTVEGPGGDGERGGEGTWEGRADKAVAGGEIGALIRGETRGLAVRVRHDARLGIEAAVRLSGAPAALAYSTNECCSW